MSDETPAPETPDETIDQDPGIPGFETIRERPAPPAVEKDADAERRERLDDRDDEGHMTAGETP